jgi:DNA primase
MPLISDRLIEELKREIPIIQLCKEYGIELKAQGKDLIGHCPFHDDKTASFIVTPSKNLWNCLGACGRGGDNIELVMRKESVSFRKAVEKLQTMSGKLPKPQQITTRSGSKHAILMSLEESEETATTSEPPQHLEQQLLRRVVEHYQQSLLNHAEAMGYLRKRCC